MVALSLLLLPTLVGALSLNLAGVSGLISTLRIPDVHMHFNFSRLNQTQRHFHYNQTAPEEEAPSMFPAVDPRRGIGLLSRPRLAVGGAAEFADYATDPIADYTDKPPADQVAKWFDKLLTKVLASSTSSSSATTSSTGPCMFLIIPHAIAAYAALYA